MSFVTTGQFRTSIAETSLKKNPEQISMKCIIKLYIFTIIYHMLQSSSQTPPMTRSKTSTCKNNTDIIKTLIPSSTLVKPKLKPYSLRKSFVLVKWKHYQHANTCDADTEARKKALKGSLPALPSLQTFLHQAFFGLTPQAQSWYYLPPIRRCV